MSARIEISSTPMGIIVRSVDMIIEKITPVGQISEVLPMEIDSAQASRHLSFAEWQGKWTHNLQLL